MGRNVWYVLAVYWKMTMSWSFYPDNKMHSWWANSSQNSYSDSAEISRSLVPHMPPVCQVSSKSIQFPAHNALHCQVGLASGRSLGRDWRRRPGLPRARWTDQLRNDAGSVPANVWRQTGHPTGPWWSDATARAGYAMMTTTMTIQFPSRYTRKCLPLLLL